MYFFAKYNNDDQVDDEIDAACNTRGEKMNAYWREMQEDKNHLEDLNIGERIILKCMLKEYYGVVGTGLVRLRVERRV
jgi:hypothetical protein